MSELKFWKNHESRGCKVALEPRRGTVLETLAIKTKLIELHHTERFELPLNDHGFIRMLVSFDGYEKADEAGPAIVWLEVRLLTDDMMETKGVIDVELGEVVSSQDFEGLSNTNLALFKLVDMDTENFSYISIGEATRDFEDNESDSLYGEV